MTAQPNDEELKRKIIVAIDRLDWTQSEFGYFPNDEEIAIALVPLIRQEREAALADFYRAHYEEIDKNPKLLRAFGEGPQKEDTK